MDEYKNIEAIKEMMRTVNELSSDKKFNFLDGSDWMNEFTQALYKTAANYMAGVIIVDYDKKEVILDDYNGLDELLDMLTFIPVIFDGIKPGSRYKVIFSGEHIWNVIFNHPNDVDNAPGFGWSVTLGLPYKF